MTSSASPTPAPTGSPGAQPELLFALPKGRMAQASLSLLQAAGLPVPTQDMGRRLVLTSDDGRVGYILAKPWDVPTFVEYGAADMGICGLDVLRESGRQLFEPLLLPFGYCRLSVAGPAGRADTPLRYESQPRIVTKYPHLAARFFQERGINAEIVNLNGSVELGPVTGMADLIVDLVETGNTLRDNGLLEYRTILQSQAVLVANKAAYRTKAGWIRRVIDAVRAQIDREQPMGAPGGPSSTD